MAEAVMIAPKNRIRYSFGNKYFDAAKYWNDAINELNYEVKYNKSLIFVASYGEEIEENTTYIVDRLILLQYNGTFLVKLQYYVGGRGRKPIVPSSDIPINDFLTQFMTSDRTALGQGADCSIINKHLVAGTGYPAQYNFCSSPAGIMLYEVDVSYCFNEQ